MERHQSRIEGIARGIGDQYAAEYRLPLGYAGDVRMGNTVYDDMKCDPAILGQVAYACDPDLQVHGIMVPRVCDTEEMGLGEVLRTGAGCPLFIRIQEQVAAIRMDAADRFMSAGISESRC